MTRYSDTSVKLLLWHAKYRKKGTPKESPRFANVAGSVRLSLLMNGSGKCKGLSRIQHLSIVMVNFERCVHTVVYC